MNFFGNKRTCLSFKALFCKCRKASCKNSKTLFYGHSLVAYLTRWANPEVMQNGAMAGAFFETYIISEIIKSFANNGEEAPIYFYRDKDKVEIDLLFI